MPRPQVCHRGGRSSPCLCCRTAFSCPSIMSASDIQAWCDVAFTKGHVRHLRSVCISRTGSRHMGAAIGHYPGPRGGLEAFRICQRDSDLSVAVASTERRTVTVHVLMQNNRNWIWPSIIQWGTRTSARLFTKHELYYLVMFLIVETRHRHIAALWWFILPKGVFSLIHWGDKRSYNGMFVYACLCDSF